MSLAYLTEKAMLLCNVLRGGDGTKATAATSSPLMNLPFEIREKIWRYVCGDRLIHVTKFPDESRYRGRLRFYNCTSKETEEAIARRFMNRKSLTLSEHADPQAYHVHCSFSKALRPNLSLRFLGTCKAIYDEAKLIPITTNTFSVDEIENAKAFALLFPMQHREKVQRLHVLMEMHERYNMRSFEDEERWQSIVSEYLVPTFPNIHSLNISTNVAFTPCWFQELDSTRGLHQGWMKAILAFKTLALRKVTINIAEVPRRCRNLNDLVWTSHDRVHQAGKTWTNRQRRAVRQDIAQRLLEKLLAPTDKAVNVEAVALMLKDM